LDWRFEIAVEYSMVRARLGQGCRAGSLAWKNPTEASTSFQHQWRDRGDAV